MPALVPSKPFEHSSYKTLKDLEELGAESLRGVNGSQLLAAMYRSLVPRLTASSEACTGLEGGIFALQLSLEDSTAATLSPSNSANTFEMLPAFENKNLSLRLLSVAEVWDHRYDSEIFFVIIDSAPTLESSTGLKTSDTDASTSEIGSSMNQNVNVSMSWSTRNFFYLLGAHHEHSTAQKVRLIALRGPQAKKLLR